MKAFAAGATFCTSLALAVLPARAVELGDCDSFAANARNLIFPVEQSTRSFAEGAVRLIALDTEEPACCSTYLMVVHPALDEPFAACTLVSDSRNTGFGALDVGAISARYVPSKGLRLEVPAKVWFDESYRSRPFGLIVDQARGTVEIAE